MNILPDFVQRPGFGTQGKAVKLKANYFEIKSIPKSIYHYDVDITPVAPSPILAILIDELQQKNKELGKFMLIYDGNKNIFTSTPLPIKQEFTEEIKFSTKVRIDPDSPFKIKIKLVNNIKNDALNNFINKSSGLISDTQNYIMCLDNVFKQQAKQNYPIFKSSYFIPEESEEIFGGLRVLQGFYQSCRPTLQRLLLNVDTCSTVFYPEGSLISFICKLLNVRNEQDLKQGLKKQDIAYLLSNLKGLEIQVDHRKDKALRFKIISISQTSAQDIKFQMADKGQTNVVKYFKDQYKINLKYPLLPCIIVKRDQHLPIEICKIVRNQRCLRKLSDRQTSDVLKFACKKPHVRFAQIEKSNRKLNNPNNKYLKAFNITVGNDFISTNARILPTPSLHYLTPQNKPLDLKPQDGVWDMRSKKFIQAAHLKSWGVLCLGNPREIPIGQIQNFIRELIKVCSISGMNVTHREPAIEYGSSGNIDANLRKLYMRTGDSTKIVPQMILCILPNQSTDLYADIKRVCDTDLGITSQCVLAKHTYQPKIQYLANVSLKINAKVGGWNTYLEPKNINFIAKKPTMVLGADISSPGPGGKGASIASIVASLDKNLCVWGSKSSKQPPKNDIIVDIKNMMKYLLLKFKARNKYIPKQILFYRDGVSEGQFLAVKNKEIKEIRDALEELGSPDTKITFIIVQKRHHTRFLAPREQQDRSGNCLPGTVVDRDVTHPAEFDFFLFSHSGIQGTSKPTHYHVLEDDNGFNADELQTISYQLCFLYARCTRSVSIVTPVYYSHLLGNRIRLHMHSAGITDQNYEGALQPEDDPCHPKESILTKLYFV